MIGRAEKVRVGLFLLLCIAIAIGSVLALAGLTTKPVTLYKVIFEESISGLDEASFVRYQGKKVGKVRSIAIDDESELPLVTIQVSPDTPVKTDTIAMLVTYSYASGTRYIELRRGTPSAPHLPPESLIKTSPSALEGLSQKAQEVLENVRKLLDEEMKHRLESLLANADQAIQQTSGSLKENQKGIDATVAEVRETVAENRPGLKHAIESVDEAAGTLRKLAAQAGEQDVVARASEVLAALKGAAEALARVAEKADTTLGRNGAAIDEILANLRATSRDLAEAAREVRDRPASLIRSEPRPVRSGE